MEQDEALKALMVGVDIAQDLASKDVTLIGTGDMGIANTTASSAITAVLTGRSVDEVTGRGTGVTDDMLRHKAAVIREAIDLHRPDPCNPVDVLAKLGGLEIAGIAGLIIGSAFHRIPVVIDGFISGAAALVAVSLKSAIRNIFSPGTGPPSRATASCLNGWVLTRCSICRCGWAKAPARRWECF